jgi:hypothetical protein
MLPIDLILYCTERALIYRSIKIKDDRHKKKRKKKEEKRKEK